MAAAPRRAAPSGWPWRPTRQEAGPRLAGGRPPVVAGSPLRPLRQLLPCHRTATPAAPCASTHGATVKPTARAFFLNYKIGGKYWMMCCRHTFTPAVSYCLKKFPPVDLRRFQYLRRSLQRRIRANSKEFLPSYTSLHQCCPPKKRQYLRLVSQKICKFLAE